MTRILRPKAKNERKSALSSRASEKRASAPPQVVRRHLLDLLNGSNAHVHFNAAIRGIPAELRGVVPKGSDHSLWQLLEHLHIAQSDILEFSRDAQYVSPPWPSGYWPVEPAPPDDKAWDKSIRAFRRDLKAFCTLLEDPATDLYAKIPHGDGQTILREALLIADHNAYHVGQIVLVRKLLGIWP
ncbi:MAG TPA: DinB family protein [Terracidiphilus sp.]|nr:DinB family protein [Terracidiphilus sp.]